MVCYSSDPGFQIIEKDREESDEEEGDHNVEVEANTVPTCIEVYGVSAQVLPYPTSLCQVNAQPGCPKTDQNSQQLTLTKMFTKH